MREKKIVDEWETLTDGGEEDAGVVTETPPEETPPTPPTEGQPPEETTVPVAVVQDLREEMKTLKADNETLKQNNLLMSQTIQNAQQQQPPQQQSQDPYSQMFSGREDDDIPTIGDLKNLGNVMASGVNTLFTQMGTQAEKSDYKEVISKYLPDVLQNDPALVSAIKSSDNPYALSYTIAKTNPKYQELVMSASNKEALAKLKANSSKTVSIDQATGGGGKPIGTKDATDMTKEEFEKWIQDVLNKG